jgi:hypothetical protein
MRDRFPAGAIFFCWVVELWKNGDWACIWEGEYRFSILPFQTGTLREISMGRFLKEIEE